MGGGSPPHPLPRKAQHRGHGLSRLMATQPAIWLLWRGGCGRCPEARGEARLRGGGEAGAWGLPPLPVRPRREDTQPPPATSHQKLWFLLVFKFLSLRKLPRTGNGELLPRGAEGLGLASGSNDSNSRQRPRSQGAETPASSRATGRNDARREGPDRPVPPHCGLWNLIPQDGAQGGGERSREHRERNTEMRGHGRRGGARPFRGESQFWAPSGPLPHPGGDTKTGVNLADPGPGFRRSRGKGHGGSGREVAVAAGAEGSGAERAPQAHQTSTGENFQRSGWPMCSRPLKGEVLHRKGGSWSHVGPLAARKRKALASAMLVTWGPGQSSLLSGRPGWAPS